MLFIEVILPVFLMAFAGFVLERRTDIDIKSLTNSSLYLFTPALVFSGLIRRDVPMQLFGQLTLFMVLFTLIFCLLAWGLVKGLRYDDESGRALTLTTSMMNIGNFGLPLVYFAFGDAALDISIVLFVLFTIPLGTIAIVIAQGAGVGYKEAFANALRIPIFYSVILAMICKTVSLQIPEFILSPIEILGEAAIPVMLVLLGMQLSRSRIRGSWRFFTLSTSIRLLVSPLLALALTMVLGIDGLARKVVILQTSTPSAVLPLLYALRYNTRPDLVSGTILTSTLCSAVTLTVILYWLV